MKTEALEVAKKMVENQEELPAKVVVELAHGIARALEDAKPRRVTIAEAFGPGFEVVR